MQIGKASVDFEAHLIDGPAGTHSVEPMVMEVLSVLVENAGQVVTRDSLIDQVWGVGFGGDERLSRAISLLRKALGDTRDKHEYIKTVPKTGYMLTTEIVAPVSNDEIIENTVIPSSQDNIASDEIASQLAGNRRVFFIAVSAALMTTVVLAAVYLNFRKNNTIPTTPKLPLVMIMDSAHPARIYDEQVKAEGATNADILSDILADLPIRTQKELISPNWHRHESIKQFDPDLIVIHYSGFKQEDSSGDRPQLRLLIEYFLKTDTEFLIYTRASLDWLEGNMNIVLEELYTENPDMKKRIELFPLLEYGEPHWMDQASAQGIKLKVKAMLNLE